MLWCSISLAMQTSISVLALAAVLRYWSAVGEGLLGLAGSSAAKGAALPCHWMWALRCIQWLSGDKQADWGGARLWVACICTGCIPICCMRWSHYERRYAT